MQVFSKRRHLTPVTSGDTVPGMPNPRGHKDLLLAGLFFATAWAEGTEVRTDTVAIPRFTHPGAGQTFYFALTDRFANGDTSNDRGGVEGDREAHGFDPTDVGYFHGGDFAGLLGRLDYIHDLGITAIWLTPPFTNKPVQRGSAGYHGYWITDFLKIDPHLGTNEDYRLFVREAHARGMRVFLDIVPNHTADVIRYAGGTTEYRTAPYRDADGREFDASSAAFNGLGDPAAFPQLDAARSFPHVPYVPGAEARIKRPDWLNDLTLYHNRGDSVWSGLSSTQGDFSGLDGVFTEHPRVVLGNIELYSHWIREFGVDGFRVDTMRHVNPEFWQAFAPEIRKVARSVGRPDFFQFGEVFSRDGDAEYLSEFSTNLPNDTTLDFGFAAAARRFVSQKGRADALASFFEGDDYYTDHDSNVHTTTTFVGNHDDGRWAHHLLTDNTGATQAELASLVRLGHGLLYLVRGQPVLYYGDEQGMIGRGGNDKQARESMFPAQAADFRNAALIGTTRTGADDKFDTSHPFYRLFAQLGALRAGSRGLRTGAMIIRSLPERDAFAFSRIDRDELVEHLVAFNNSRQHTLRLRVGTSQSPGAVMDRVFTSDGSDDAGDARIIADESGSVVLTLAPLQFAVWRAAVPLGPAVAPSVRITSPAFGASLSFTSREVDGYVFPSRHEIRAGVTGGDGVAEVTFAMRRSSRPGQLDWLGTDDAPPYRVFWRPPPDLGQGEQVEFIATVDDLRGNRSSASVAQATVDAGGISFGTTGARTPDINGTTIETTGASPVSTLRLSVDAAGTPPLEFQWLRDGRDVDGATGSTLVVPSTPESAGSYRVLVRNLAGTAISEPMPILQAAHAARLEKHPAFQSAFVPPRQVDVWLPPGYDADNARRWPVIYMHDGQNLFQTETSFGGVPWSIDESMNRLISTGRTRGAIVVGVWNTGAERFAEYMPRKPMTEDVMMNYGPNIRVPLTSLRSDEYLRFIVTELKPFIDRTYRTNPAREATFIMGSSMGGLISAYALAEYPEVFGGAASISTHWPAGEGRTIDYIASRLPAPGTARLYFDHGTGTLDASYEHHQRRLDELLRGAGWTEGQHWITRRFPGAEHSERDWRKRVDIPLAFLLEGQ